MSNYLFEILSAQTGQVRDRGSKFLAFAWPVHTQAEAEAHMAALRKSYHDATHHCYAWRMGAKGETAFADDDGEPAHTAGTPILAAIRSRELTNVLVAVVRYFGGTKLGTRGLIEAYRLSADAALENAEVAELIPMSVCEISFGYGQTSLVNRILHRVPHSITASRYDADCALTVRLRTDDLPGLVATLTEEGIACTPQD